MKKRSGYIIILSKCTVNDNHMIYGSWDVEDDRQNFCHFGPFFALLPPSTPSPFQQPKKWKFWKSEKNPIKNHDHMIHCSWNTTHDRCNFYFSFSAIFCPFAFFFFNEKKKKTSGDIIILHMCTPKTMITQCAVLEI